MSNEFLDEISAAVDTAGGAEHVVDVPDTSLVTEVADEPTSTETSDTEREILSLNRMDDEPAEKKAEPVAKKPEPKVEEVAKQPDAQQVAEQAAADANKQLPNDKRSMALDTFLKEDENNNLVLDDGTIVATSGKSRTFFERVKREGREQREAAKRMAVSNMELAGKFKELYTAYDTALAQPKMDFATATGLPQEDIEPAIAMMKEYKTNPLEALKKMLTRAHMSGIDVSTLGVGGSLDPNTVKESLTSIVTDMLAKNKQAETLETPPMTEDIAIGIAQKFLKENPDAGQYEEQIAFAKNKYPDMSLEEIWTRISAHLARQPEPPMQRYKSQTPPPQKPAPITKRVTAPSNDYATMSFEQIAQSIKDEIR